MATMDALLNFFDQRYYESACAGKETYPSKDAAESIQVMYHSRKIRHFRPRGHHDFWLELCAYRCRHCGQYHLGNG